jgi:signal transduction histidine kinase/DNA-binding NarL/FixJ family response regulator
MKKIALFVLAFTTTFAAAQPAHQTANTAESIRQKLAASPDDTTRLKLLIELKNVVPREEKEAVILEAFEYFSQRVEVAGKAEKAFLASDATVEALQSPTILYQMRGKPELALEYGERAADVAAKTGNQVYAQRAKVALLSQYAQAEKTDTAIQLGLSMERITMKNMPADMSATYCNLMHFLYFKKKDMVEAVNWSEKMLVQAEKTGDPLDLAAAYRAQLRDMFYLEDYAKALEIAQTGLSRCGDDERLNIQNFEFAQKGAISSMYLDSLKLARALSDRTLAYAQALKERSYWEDAYTVLVSLAMKTRNYPQAIVYSDSLLKYEGSMGNPGKYSAYCDLGAAYLALGNLEKALLFAKKAEAMLDSTELAKSQVHVNELLAKIYEKEGRFEEALRYFKTAVALRDTFSTIENNRTYIRQQFQLDFNKKEAARRQTRNALLVGLAFLALLAFFFWYRNRLKNRTLKLVSAEKAEAERQRRRAEASEAFKSRFLANMSHEIRTPLHGIAGFTDLLLETSLAEKQRRWLSSIHHSTERLGEVVNDILDLSKLEAGQVKLRSIPFSPARIARDVQEALLLRAENKGIELTLTVGADVPEAVSGDPTRLYQILMNLVGNAVKFTEKGAVQLMLGASDRVTSSHPATTATLASDRVTSSHPVTTLRFSVSDTGIGIPPEKLSAVFDSFQQAGEDTTARFGGTGLGLTIARELVQLHGSDIEVESEVGKGSVFAFTLTLPLAEAADLEMAIASGDALHFTQPLRILLADDNALNREIAVEAIRRHFENAEIVEVVNGKEAVERLASKTFDVILMDMQMPEMTGTQATRYIRTHLQAEKRDIPIIALTASATPEEIGSALESGMNRHLSKPFKPRELAQVVAETLGLRADSGRQDFQNLPNLQAASHSALDNQNPPDLHFLTDFCDGDEAQMRHFIQKFIEQYPLEIERLKVALRNGDRDAMYQVAHSFRPQLEFVGLKKAAALILLLEQGVREGMAFGELADLLLQVKAALQRLPEAAEWLK